jgi:hypothetical protein
MSSTVMHYLLWLAAPAMQISMAVLILKRGLNQQFSFFFSYTLLQIVNAVVLFGVYHFSYSNYFYTYWTCTALSGMLGFAVIYEVFQYAVRPYTGLRDLSVVMFRWSALLLLLVSGVVAATGPGSSAHHITMAVVNVERGVRLMQAGLLLFTLLFASFLGLSLRNFAFGIALGFGVFATTDLTLFSVRAQIGPEWNSALSLISSAAYNFSVLTWFVYCLMPQSLRVRNQIVFHPVLDRWNQAALSATAERLAPIEQPAYLTEIEQAVEDILQKGARKAQ